MAGDDLQVLLFFLSLTAVFGVEAARAETSRRVVFAILAVGCGILGLFWLHIKTVWPPFTHTVGSIAGNPVAWFVVVMFALAIFALQRPVSKSAVSTNTTKNKATITQAVVPPERRKDRVFIDSSLEYFVNLVKDKATIHANKLTDTYIGKWIGLTGIVDNILETFATLREDVNHVHVVLHFNEEWKERFYILELNKTISVIGKIKTIRSYQLELTDCELL